LSKSGPAAGANADERNGGALKNSRGTVKSADRVLTLFEFLGRWDREISHAEIAEMLGIPKSSLTQLLKDLVSRGWLAYSAPTKGYFLGEAITKLARGAVNRRDLAEMAKPLLVEITEATGESAELHVLRGHALEVAANNSCRANLTALMHIGDHAPLYAMAGGKAILAHLPPDMQEEYIASVQFEPLTPKTIRSVEELRIQLDAVRREGIAYCFEEYTTGVIGTSRPVLDLNGNVLGAIDVPTPTVRYDNAARKRIADALAAAVSKMHRQLELSGPIVVTREPEGNGKAGIRETRPRPDA
jgi:DNA-binding IclR family transcriptional regulator